MKYPCIFGEIKVFYRLWWLHTQNYTIVFSWSGISKTIKRADKKKLISMYVCMFVCMYSFLLFIACKKNKEIRIEIS